MARTDHRSLLSRRPDRPVGYRRVVDSAIRFRHSSRPAYPASSGLVAADEQRRATLLLLFVAIGIVFVHAVFAGLDRPIHWDETVYFTQVNPSRATVFMEPHRTRGVSLLVAPIAIFDPSMVVLRSYLVLLGAAGTFAAFRTWIPTVGMAAPLAAALYSAFWVTVFYSVEILPNHPVALLSIGALGVVTRLAGRDDAGRSGWVLAALFTLLALVRPPDAFAIGFGLAVVILVLRRDRALWLLTSAVLGGAAGVGVWLTESAIRFGFDPLTTVRSAGEYSVGGPRANQFPLYVRSLETRLRCNTSCLQSYIDRGAGWELPPTRTTLILVAAIVLTFVALVTAGRRGWLIPAAPVVVAVPLVALYSVSGGAMNLRYMLPAFALLSIPPAIGVMAVWRAAPRLGTPIAAGARLGLVVAVAATAWWQVGITLDRFENPGSRHRAKEIGLQLRAVADGEPCVVAARVSYPPIQYWSGCLAAIATKGDDGTLQPPLGELGSYVDLAERGEAGARVFAVAEAELAEESPIAHWQVLFPEEEPIDGYRLFEHRSGDPLPPPPCPTVDEGEVRLLARLMSGDC